MMLNIRQLLLNAEDKFLSAIASGPDALQDFYHEWLRLLRNCEEHAEKLDEDTAALAHVTSSRLAILADSFSDVEEDAASLTALGMEELDAVFDSPSFNSLSVSAVASSPLPSNLSPCKWLLKNLHNPYPPPPVKSIMEGSSELMGKSAGKWFIKARRRIGWSRVLRARFGSTRSAMLDAAFRAFVRDDSKNPLDPELLMEFVAVKKRAEDIFGENITSQTSSRLSTCDFPDRSRSISPVPLWEESENDGVHLRTLQVGQERSIVHLSETTNSSFSPGADEISSKRRRLPSSASLAPPLHSTCVPNSAKTQTISTCTPQRPQKRRLSEVVAERAPKRPNGLEGLRLHAVSEPLPLPDDQNQLDDWFQAFQLPLPATTSACELESLNLTPLNGVLFPQEYDIALPANSFTCDMNGPSSNQSPSIIASSDLSTIHPSPSQPGLDDLAWNEIFNLDSILDTSYLASFHTPSDSSCVDLAILPSSEDPSLAPLPSPSIVASAAPPTKSSSDLNPMLQAFRDFLSTSINPVLPWSNINDGGLIDTLTTYQGDNFMAQN